MSRLWNVKRPAPPVTKKKNPLQVKNAFPVPPPPIAPVAQHSKVNPSKSELHLRIEECYEYFKQLEKERKRTEMELLKSGKKIGTPNYSQVSRLPSNPSRVDRLIVDQLREHARLQVLGHRMGKGKKNDRFFKSVDSLMEAIRKVQNRRREEVIATEKDDKIVLNLASSIAELSVTSRRMRTSLWCALQSTNLSENV